MSAVDPAYELVPGTWAIPTPYQGTFSSITAYAIEDQIGGVHLIDTGWGSDPAWAALTEGLRAAGHSVQDVRSVWLTHAHPDHAGAAGRLRGASDAPVGMHKDENRVFGTESEEQWRMIATRWGLPEPLASELGPRSFDFQWPETQVALRDGETLPIPGRRIMAVATPGHTRGHLTFADLEREVLFTGDHVLPGRNPGIAIGGRWERGPIAEYLNSLSRLAIYDDFLVAPGHGTPFPRLADRRREHEAHVRARAGAAEQLVAGEPDISVYDLARGLPWSQGWDGLQGFAVRSALTQTEYYLDYVLRRGHLELDDVSG